MAKVKTISRRTPISTTSVNSWKLTSEALRPSLSGPFKKAAFSKTSQQIIKRTHRPKFSMKKQRKRSHLLNKRFSEDNILKQYTHSLTFSVGQYEHPKEHSYVLRNMWPSTDIEASSGEESFGNVIENSRWASVLNFPTFSQRANYGAMEGNLLSSK